MLSSKNIYIDTQVYIANNFFQSQNLARLAQLANVGHINIYMTGITKQEIINNGRKQLSEALTLVKSFKKDLNKKARILRNLKHFEELFDLKEVDIENDIRLIVDDLEKFITTARVITIPFDGIDLKKVLDRYFKSEKPFNESDKKSEFPDAIVLSSIEKYCVDKGTTMIILSGDNDFKNITSEYVTHMENVKDLLNEINTHLESETTKWFEQVLEYNRDKIKEIISKQFKEKLEDEYGWENDIEDVNVNAIEIIDIALVEKDDTVTTFTYQVSFEVTFSASLGIEDYSESTYDKEDGRYYNVYTFMTPVEMQTVETAEITITAYHGDEFSPEEADAEISVTALSIPSTSSIIAEADQYQ